jgi:O-antigen/teichoic acid export membrane protein
VKSLWRSTTLRSAAVLGLSGVGFAVANLVLARALPTEEYALVTLVVALVNVGYPLAAAGVDGMVNRRRLEAGPRLFRRLMRASIPVAIVFATIGLAGYETSVAVALMILLCVAAGSAVQVAGAQFQSEQRFGISLALHQSPNLILLLVAGWVLAAGSHRAQTPLAVWTAGFLVSAAVGWSLLFRERHAKPHRSVDFPWSEAFSIAGLSVAGLLLIQIERLMLPHLLPLEDLATYGVLAAIAGSLFRVLQMGVGYSLLPRLRAAPGVIERRRLLFKEARLVVAVAAVGSVVIWLATPRIEDLFLGGKYHLSGALVLAAVVTGFAKVLNGFAQSAVSALAEPRELHLVSVLGWVSVGVAMLGAAAGARWGLPGVIYGVGLGWVMRAVVGMVLAARHLRLPAAAQTVTS